ncbi:sugar porter family MFS transporter [Rhodococcus opacus]|nr:sugar porter family MFS transporter [Rhodococcus opacus]
MQTTEDSGNSTEPDSSDGRMSPLLLATTVAATLGGFLFGFDSAIINGAVEPIRHQFGLAPLALGLAVSCALLGAGAGAWAAGVCADRIGRIRTMLIAAFLLTVSAVGSGLAFASWDFFLWRIIGGVGIGFASVITPAYIAELSPARYRGRLGTLQQNALVVGIFIALLISTFLARSAGGAEKELWLGLDAWRWMFITGAVPSVIYGVLASRLPESPRYLVTRGRIGEAESVLEKTVGIDSAEARSAKVNEIQKTIIEERKQHFSDLLGGRFIFLPLVWVGILLSVFQQFVGINVIFYYGTTLWQSVGFDESDSFTFSVITAVANIFGTIIAIALIDRVGRRPLLLCGAAIMALSLTAMAAAFAHSSTVDGALTLPTSWGLVALIAANMFVIGFGASWGPIVWVLLGEMFPNRIRAVALGFAAALQWVANFVVSTTFPSLSALGLQYAYGLYGICAVLALVFVWKWVPETNGRKLESMDSLVSSGNPTRAAAPEERSATPKDDLTAPSSARM